MNYSNRYEIVRGMFWDGQDKNGKQYKLDHEGITVSLGRALIDYTSRTSAKKDDEKIASVENMTKALPKFIKCIEEYFEDIPKASVAEYDDWHDKMCQLFITCITDAKIRETVTYGKAQKIVNMTMKTIYCLEGAEAKNDQKYFTYCHMPLDSVILGWFKEAIAGPSKRKILKGKVDSWSALQNPQTDEYTDKGKSFYSYHKLTKLIRDYFKEGNASNRYDGLTPLEAEFYIWPEMQYEQAAKALMSQDLPHQLIHNQNVTVKNDTIKNLNAQLSQLITTLSQFY